MTGRGPLATLAALALAACSAAPEPAGDTAAAASTARDAEPAVDPAAPAGPGAPAPAGPRRATAEGFGFVVPAGWEPLEPRPMRAGYHGCGDGAEVWFTVLGGDGGGTAANVRRWCDQVGAARPDDAAIEALPTLPMLRGDAVFVDLTAVPGARDGLLGAIRQLDGRAVFVKLTGPAAAVAARKGDFVAFCASFAEEL